MVNHVGGRKFPIPGIQMNVSPAVAAQTGESTRSAELTARSANRRVQRPDIKTSANGLAEPTTTPATQTRARLCSSSPTTARTTTTTTTRCSSSRAWVCSPCSRRTRWEDCAAPERTSTLGSQSASEAQANPTRALPRCHGPYTRGRRWATGCARNLWWLCTRLQGRTLSWCHTTPCTRGTHVHMPLDNRDASAHTSM